MRGANLVLRFLLELSALAATSYWGFATASGFTQWVLGVGAPALVAVVWGLFLAPKRKVELRKPARFAIELLVFAPRRSPWSQPASRYSASCSQPPSSSAGR
jgi:Protein of unknown function (DUF2568)